MRYLTIALAKGRLASKAMDMFEQIGISCEEMKDKNSRKLIFVNEDLGICGCRRRGSCPSCPHSCRLPH